MAWLIVSGVIKVVPEYAGPLLSALVAAAEKPDQVQNLAVWIGEIRAAELEGKAECHVYSTLD